MIRKMKDVAVHVTMLVLLLTCPVWAQTTRPAPNAFSAVILKLSNGLVNGDVAMLPQVINKDTTITSFDGDVSETGGRMFAATNGGAIVTSRCYRQLPMNLASDIATDFSNAPSVPDVARKDMTPASDSVVKANVTAAQWIAQTLRPSANQLVGVIVVWPPLSQGSIDQRPAPLRPVFVLVKGEMDGDRVVLKQILFGYPLDRI